MFFIKKIGSNSVILKRYSAEKIELVSSDYNVNQSLNLITDSIDWYIL